MSEENVGRMLTVRLVIRDPKVAEWLWDAHLHGVCHGVEIEALANGDLFQECDDLKKQLENTDDAADAAMFEATKKIGW